MRELEVLHVSVVCRLEVETQDYIELAVKSERRADTLLYVSYLSFTFLVFYTKLGE